MFWFTFLLKEWIYFCSPFNNPYDFVSDFVPGFHINEMDIMMKVNYYAIIEKRMVSSSTLIMDFLYCFNSKYDLGYRLQLPRLILCSIDNMKYLCGKVVF